MISVVIPTFNRADVLLRSIFSVLNQTYKEKEIIVVDDGSTDRTEELLSPLISENKITYIKQSNFGVSAARNNGVKVANGEWIAFLDSDDEWVANKLEMQMQFFEHHPKFQIVYTDEVWIRNGVTVNPRKIHKKRGGDIFVDCVARCFIAPSSVLMSKKLFFDIGEFDTSFTICEDYDLWLKISLTEKIGYIDSKLIVKYGGHDDQLSTQYFAMDMWRIRALVNILQKFDLSAGHRECVIDFLKAKTPILLNGFSKHNNPLGFHELQKLVAPYLL